MANGMSGLYVGSSGLRSAQNAINTASHNLSNINTKGYTRQQVTYSDSRYYTIGNNGIGNMQYGIGVDLQEIRRVRDEFMDKAYRVESGRTAFYESQYSAVEEVETLFDEMEGVTMEDSINNLWNAINELAKNPGSTVTRTELVQYANEFVNRATAIYDALVKYQDMLNEKISNTVDRINELGQTIHDLNKQISAIENAGEKANDLRDERDAALDELGTLVKMQYSEETNQEITIAIEGVPFLSGNTLYTMGTEKIENSDMLTPVWTQMGGRSVFMFKEEFNSLNNNDIGELKGLLLARGNLASADYRDIPVEPRAEDYETTAEYDAAVQDYEAQKDHYNDYIDQSVVLTSMAGLDKLVNGIAEAINNVLCPEVATNQDITATDGTVIPAGSMILHTEEASYLKTDKYKDVPLTSYGMDGETVGQELFSREYTNRYVEKEFVDENGATRKIYIRNDVNDFGLQSRYTLGNLEINPEVLRDYQKIPLGTKSGGEDFDKAEQLMDIWEQEFSALNPSKYAKENFRGFYNSMVSEMANRGEVLRNMTEYQQSMTNEIDAKRNGQEGVSSDEELTNLIKYQNAYNASSRYINVVSEMLEHLIMRLGG